MNISIKRSLLALSLLLFFFHSCKKDETTTPATTGGTVSNPARQAALDDYNINYLGSSVSSTGWTGSVSTCTAGRCSQATAVAVIKRINYFRRMVGLNSQCQLDTSLYQQEQEAALLQSANNALSHTPPTSWTCYTSLGSTGCASSNLALGYTSTSAITAFLSDDGIGNEPVGHRRWILHSRKQTFSFGSTSNAMALYVLRNDTNSIVPSFIAYPPNGYMPRTLVPNRWSFSIPGANFSAATVSMTGPGGAVIPVTIISSTANGYGDNTMVWTATGINTSSDSDVSYTVTVNSVASASQTSYSYTTSVFKP